MPTKIPNFTLSGVLPPFIGSTPTVQAARAPYQTDVVDLATRFGTSRHRLAVLQGFLDHRAALNGLGFVNGFQWCNGSFVEDKEPPSDMDVVTFFHRPSNALATPQLAQIQQQNSDLFNPTLTKTRYHCDMYYVDFSLAPAQLAARTHYWFGLFTHRRLTAEWKGLVQVPLYSPNDDAAARILLSARQQAQVSP
jgi:hypothetical protein